SESALGEPPYPSAEYQRQFAAYLAEARLEGARAWDQIRPEIRPRWTRRWWGRPWYYLVSAWTGSETEAAWAALHRADSLVVMVEPDELVRLQSYDMETTFREAKDIRVGTRQFQAYQKM